MDKDTVVISYTCLFYEVYKYIFILQVSNSMSSPFGDLLVTTLKN